jgi:hypothetical protein
MFISLELWDEELRHDSSQPVSFGSALDANLDMHQLKRHSPACRRRVAVRCYQRQRPELCNRVGAGEANERGRL